MESNKDGTAKPFAEAHGYAAYVAEAMDYIIKETRWAGHFPRQCHDRIRQVCEAVKAGTPLPFKPHNDPSSPTRPKGGAE